MLISFELICILLNSLISYSSYNSGNSNSTKENEKQLELDGGGGGGVELSGSIATFNLPW